MVESSSYLHRASLKWRHRQVGFLAFFGFLLPLGNTHSRFTFGINIQNTSIQDLETDPHLDPRAINSHLVVPIQNPYYHLHEHGAAANPMDIPSNRVQATEGHSIHNWVRRARAQHCPCVPGSEVPRSRDTRPPDHTSTSKYRRILMTTEI